MKNFSIFFILAFLTAGAFAGGSSSKPAAPKYNNVSQTDTSGKSWVCGQWGDPSSIADGTVVFIDFPATRTCVRDSGNGNWATNGSALCPGYTSVNRDRVNLEQDSVGKCWKWKCKSQYGVMVPNTGECRTIEEHCATMGLVVRNNQCMPKWCSGWEAGFDGNVHVEYAKTGCNEYRCKADTYFATSQDKTKCKPCVPVKGTTAGGGCYANLGNFGANAAGAYSGDTIYNECAKNEYVVKVNNRWQCNTIPSVGADRIEKCWNCADKATMIDCLQKPVSAEGCI